MTCILYSPVYIATRQISPSLLPIKQSKTMLITVQLCFFISTCSLTRTVVFVASRAFHSGAGTHQRCWKQQQQQHLFIPQRNKIRHLSFETYKSGIFSYNNHNGWKKLGSSLWNKEKITVNYRWRSHNPIASIYRTDLTDWPKLQRKSFSFLILKSL